MTEPKKPTAIPTMPHKDVDNIGFIASLFVTIKKKLMMLKERLDFSTLTDEYSKYMDLKDRFIRNKEKVSIDDVFATTLLGEIDALRNRLEEFESLSTDEVLTYKKNEQPFTIMGRRIELKGYKNIATYAMYGLGVFIGYKYILRPYVFPAMGKLLTTKVKVRKNNFNTIGDANYRII